MKTILAYGDSLTFGMDAVSMRRHAHEDQWPAALEAGLGGAARVINGGLGGRTTVFDDHTNAADRNGARILPTMLSTFMPLDLVVLFLGTNDMKTAVSGSAFMAAMGVKRLAEIVRGFPYAGLSPVPEVLVVAPPLVGAVPTNGKLPLASPRSDESHLFAPYYRQMAEEIGATFFDAATVAEATAPDGVHLDADNTRKIGVALVPVVRQILRLQESAT